MPSIVLLVGDKGGIGKSTWARAFADLCRASGVKVGLFDGDWSCRSLFRMFCDWSPDGTVVPLEKQNPRTGCVLYDLRHRELGRDLLLDSMGLRGIDIFLHDLPSGFRSDLVNVMGIPQVGRAVVEFVRSCQSVGVRPVFVAPLTANWTTHQTAVWLAENAPAPAAVIAVRNEQYGESAFAVWRSGDRDRFLQAGGIEIAMPYLEAQTFQNSDVLAARFSALAGSDKVSMADRMRIGSWLRRFADEVRPLASVFGVERWPSAGPLAGGETPPVAGVAAGGQR